MERWLVGQLANSPIWTGTLILVVREQHKPICSFKTALIDKDNSRLFLPSLHSLHSSLSSLLYFHCQSHIFPWNRSFVFRHQRRHHVGDNHHGHHYCHINCNRSVLSRSWKVQKTHWILHHSLGNQNAPIASSWANPFFLQSKQTNTLECQLLLEDWFNAINMWTLQQSQQPIVNIQLTITFV